MAQYRVGFANTTAGTNVVTFTNDGDSEPELLANAAAGDEIQIGDNPTYFTIASVDADDQVTLTANYPEDNEDAEYNIVKDFTPSLNIPLARQGDLHFADLFSRAMQVIDRSIPSGLGGLLTFCGFFPGIFESGEETSSGEEFRFTVPADYRVTGGRITRADALGSTGTTKVRLSDSAVGTSGETTLDLEVGIGSTSGSEAVGTIEFFEGGTLYAYIPSGGTGGHGNVNFQVILERIS